MPEPRNRLQNRSDLLADALRARVNETYKALTEPVPAFQTKVPERDQIKIYQQRVASGELATLRESGGGPYPDTEVDRYVQRMEGMINRNAPDVFGLPPLEEEF